MNNVLDFGAEGDGKTLDTKAIQAAIDAGGTVYFPKGEYLTGTLFLKSNGGLHLEDGAVIKASTNKADYNESDCFEQNCRSSSEGVDIGKHLIIAAEQENVSIGGSGTIYGSAGFWVNESGYNADADIYIPNKERPGQMIYFCECKNVKISGVSLRYAPFWHLFLHGCENVSVSGLNIGGEPKQYTNDGIDIDSCKNVTVSDCIIRVGDDALTLRCDTSRLKKKRCCENVCVTNCVLSSNGAYGIRIGVGEGLIRNCVLSGITICDTMVGINLINRFSPNGKCTSIENIKFSNFIINASRTFDIGFKGVDAHPPIAEECFTRNITFSDIYAKSYKNNRVLGAEKEDKGKISDIRFKDCDFVFYGDVINKGWVESPECWESQSSGNGFNVRNVENLEFNNVRISYTDDSFGWNFDYELENDCGTVFKDCTENKGIGRK